MEIKYLENSKRLPVDFTAWQLLAGEKVELVVLHLTAGEKMERHANPLDVVFYVLEGSGKLEVGDDSQHLVEGGCVAVAAGDQRRWHNDSESDLRLLVVKILT